MPKRSPSSYRQAAHERVMAEFDEKAYVQKFRLMMAQFERR
jgi:hypothetical protein